MASIWQLLAAIVSATASLLQEENVLPLALDKKGHMICLVCEPHEVSESCGAPIVWPIS